MRDLSEFEAPYATLVKLFGDDGTVSPRDDYKSMAEWDVQVAPYGEVEVYDYKVGKCYDPSDGLDREEITTWHIQGDARAVAKVLAEVRQAVGS